MSVRVKALVLVCGLGLGLAIGCKGGGGGGDLADAYVNKLKSCGLLSDGELPTIDDELDEQTQCILTCLLRTSCEELEQLTCDPFDVEPSAEVAACFDACEGEFVCTDGETIPANWECDGEPDCEDESDEQGCVLFECADGSGSFPQAFRCDGVGHCEDESDEQSCPGRVACADGNGSVPSEYLCDGDMDCEDGSDEQGCPAYVCADGQSVVGGARCDFYEDCEDGSDELGCAQLVCPEP